MIFKLGEGKVLAQPTGVIGGDSEEKSSTLTPYPMKMTWYVKDTDFSEA